MVRNQLVSALTSEVRVLTRCQIPTVGTPQWPPYRSSWAGSVSVRALCLEFGRSRKSYLEGAR